MSSIHSQSSDSHLNDQDQHMDLQRKDDEQQQATQFFSEKTPAIQEEEEEDTGEEERESEGNREETSSDSTSNNKEEINFVSRNTTKAPRLQKTKSHRSSCNSSSSSNSNGNGVTNKSTMTFEKQKVAPPRARAQSAQSVLSNLSLRSLLLQNNLTQQQPQQPPAGNENYSATNYGNLNQQIQSPAMSSSMRRKAPTNVMFRRNSSENEIGLQLPFTDDKRLDLDPKHSLRRNFSRNSLMKRQQSANIVETVEIEDDESNEEEEAQNYQMNLPDDKNITDEDDEVSQKKLTEKALRKLSLLKRGSLQKRKSDNSSQNSDKVENVNESTDNDNETFEKITSQEGSMTHLQFGNKRVILDSSSFLLGNNGVRSNQQQMQQQFFQPLQKASSDSIQQLSVNTNGKSKTNNSKKNFKQICNPKKPLYVPAVLRDTAETNITIDDLMRPDSPQHTLLNNFRGNSGSGSNHNPSSQASVYSTTSSILETCRKKISSFLFPNSDFSNSDLPYGLNSESPRLPRKDHWLPDSKRASCHYCHKLFTFFERKHHCRHCGDIFCDQHLSHWLYLNSNAEFIIGGGGMGTLSKVCDGCLGDYENLIRNPSWRSQKDNNQPNQEDSADSKFSSRCNSNEHNPNNINYNYNANNYKSQQSPEAISVDKKDQSDDSKKENGDIIGSVVGSVPADWNWSSF